MLPDSVTTDLEEAGVVHASDRWLTLDDARRAALLALPGDVRDLLDEGSADDTTVTAVRAALDAVQLIPRVLSGVSHCRTSTRLLGAQAALPVGVAPLDCLERLHPEGEIATARAAAAAGVPCAVGMRSGHLLEAITAECPDTWFQLPGLPDRVHSAALVDRAESVGCRALIVSAHPGDARDTAFSWTDLAWLRGQTELPLVVKGILHPDDAAHAAHLGADAIVVSHHGTRQLGTVAPGISLLPAICDAVARRAEVLLDSGIRSGTDVLKALALGASGVLVGRPVLWGLAADGQRGVERILSLLRSQLEDVMVLAGCRDVPQAWRLDHLTQGGDARFRR
ncbi:alpha-hydroxy-acid oxidizing protein [Streptomyces sp. Caat 7-52]|uniref:alpha-hydroxy-acid oxidizing protein n=1 Tax=Streptomyces sp. Caat 7-52 TaxID=2949637 RepID=UPI002035EC91|nr:alpha-hydroxy-acid oxidizing protein [Streptomyces sp. Caat 7-52]